VVLGGLDNLEGKGGNDEKTLDLGCWWGLLHHLLKKRKGEKAMLNHHIWPISSYSCLPCCKAFKDNVEIQLGPPPAAIAIANGKHLQSIERNGEG